MIGNIAHQWRQPPYALGLVIANLCDAYEFKKLDDEKMEKFADKSQRLIQKMSSTIDDFRNFFQPNKDEELFVLLETVNEAFHLVEASFFQHQIHVDIHIDPSFKTVGYKNEFSHVILNLLNNARDILEERSIKRKEISICAVQNAEEIVITIKDNGGGIPVHILPHIFEPYYTTKEQGKGTGIGLYMSKIIIEEHLKGVLTAANDNDGAVFTLIVKAA